MSIRMQSTLNEVSMQFKKKVTVDFNQVKT